MTIDEAKEILLNECKSVFCQCDVCCAEKVVLAELDRRETVIRQLRGKRPATWHPPGFPAGEGPCSTDYDEDAAYDAETERLATGETGQ